MSIVGDLTRRERRKLRRMAQRSKGNQARRALAILLLDEGKSVSEVSRLLKSARSTLYRWIGWYQLHGVDGLKGQHAGRPVSSITDEVIELVREMLEQSPREWGYQRSTWTTELLADAINHHLNKNIHSSTIRRLLPRIGYGWRRSRPTLCIRDPHKNSKMAAIEQALKSASPDTEVFYVDEADIDLNPRCGFLWSRKGRQVAIPTPGNNRKCYLAGALNARTGRVVWTAGLSKSSELFIELLKTLQARYRKARKLVLILDNYIIHKSRRTQHYLQRFGRRFELLFQPVYHPWVNRIERLWKVLHDNVTRNHRYPNMTELMAAVHSFLGSMQPFRPQKSVS